MKNHKRLSLFLIMGFSLLISGAIIEVDTTGAEGDSLQKAIDSTTVLPGIDTVLVKNGTYHLTINPETTFADTGFFGLFMQDSVVLLSENGASACTLTALSQNEIDTAYRVIYCYQVGNTSVIKGFTIKDGNANFSFECGGGIWIHFSSLTILNNKITDNSANSYGGGLYISSYSHPILINNQITNNWAGVFGGGVYVDAHSSATLVGNQISNNSCDDLGGGLSVDYESSVSLRDNLICNNTSHRGGGICLLWYSSVNLSGDIIVANIADSGGAFYNKYSNKIEMDSCLVVDNVSLDETKSGLAFLTSEADSGITFYSYNSNLYYNSFQPDTEIDNNSSVTLSLENNYWWFTDSSEIDQLIDGPASFYPFEDSPLWNGIPSEPLSIDSIRNYRTNSYLEVAESIGTYDSLYISVYGSDANPDIKELAMVILSSSRYPTGVAVTLYETDTASGIYRGEVCPLPRSNLNLLRYDDAHQNIGVNITDTIKMVVNMDTTSYFYVGFNAPFSGIEEEGENDTYYSFNISQRVIGDKLQLSYFLPREMTVRIDLYDVNGRAIVLLRNRTEKGYHNLEFNLGYLPNGIYFIRANIGRQEITEKILKIR
ncbi:T9SS type A sorting domain-containing protein [candidate division WOR-3 bacterium]|nr:T9SS type A sorting domain-containing protein [candidate division WOR-3 bacterium]